MLRTFLLSGFILSCLISLGNEPPEKPYIRTRDGVIIYPDELLSGNARAVRLQVVTANIIRVIASPTRELPSVESLVTVFDTTAGAEWQLIEQNPDRIIVKTKAVSAEADLKTGAVQFRDASGKVILREKRLSRKLDPAIYEGQRTFQLTQTFDTNEDDAWYGLGQHQDGLFNYKGYQVFFFQNNTEVAVPFLVSKKNYGILWDNYSLTSVGDIRNYKPLSALRLYSREGESGWLTATYFNDRNKPGDVLLEKAESQIAMEYLNDSKLLLPPAFKTLTGTVRWEGAIGSDIDGVHRLRFTYGGYLKVWLDGKLVLDRWRQAWNPCAANLEVSFENGKKHPIKIEWTPDGNESYVSLKYMDPITPDLKDAFSFKSEAGKQMDYYFVYGENIDSVISGYRYLTGKATMLPKWTMGLWQSRERYKTQEEILSTVAEFRKRQIPLDNIVLDWSYWKQDAWGSQEFEAARFPNPDSMIDVLHKKYRTRFMISVWPKFYEGIPAYNAFDSKGWLYKRNIADRQRDWIAQGYISTFYDPFNKDARAGFWKLIDEKIYRKGVDAWWMDASEPDILSNVTPQKRKEQMYPLAAGITSEYMNAYPLQNAKGIYEGQRATNPNQRVFVLTRSAFAGLQRYAAATWSGDIAARWHDMKLQIPAGINFSMSGLPYWTMDIGGFAVEPRFTKPDAENLEEWRELMTRWYQFGAFVPLFRVHGQFPYREIYNVAPTEHPAYQSMLYYDKLRYRLMPYIYSLAGQCYRKDYTMMRGLVMDFPSDETVTNIGDEYMFGPSLLIAPVYEYKQRERQLYLPKGNGWYDFYDGKYSEGGKQITVDAPYSRIPLFVRSGSILPCGPAIQFTDEKQPETITLFVYGGSDGKFTLYEDEGTNYNYEKGNYAEIEFTYSDKSGQLTVGKRNGQFPGMLKSRNFRVVYVGPASPVAWNPDAMNGKTIKYNGNAVTVSLK